MLVRVANLDEDRETKPRSSGIRALEYRVCRQHFYVKAGLAVHGDADVADDRAEIFTYNDQASAVGVRVHLWDQSIDDRSLV